MTRLLWIAIASIACACGDSGSAGFDATGGDGDDGTGSGAHDGGIDGLSAGAHTIAVTLAHRPNNAAAYSFIVGYQDGSAPWKLRPNPHLASGTRAAGAARLATDDAPAVLP